MTTQIPSRHLISTPGGGAHAAASRLVAAISSQGSPARLVSTYSHPEGRYREIHRAIEWSERRIVPRAGSQVALTLFPRPGVDQTLMSEDPWEITHLHWIAPEVLDLVPHMSGPVVWTLHDAWAFTGACHYPLECRRFEVDCESCPAARSFFHRIIARQRRRRASVTQRGITAIAPSLWMKDLANRSGLFSEVVHIPNCLDPTFLNPPSTRSVTCDTDALRVVAVASDWSDKRKGLDLLIEVTKRVATTTRAKFTIVGKTTNDLQADGCHVEFLGDVTDTESLIRILDSNDVFLNVSLADNLPSTLIEAQARSLPVVTGSAGGCPEVVADGVTGFVRESADDISRAIDALARARELVSRMGRAGRSLTLSTFSPEVVSRQHLDLYARLQDNH